MEDGAMQHGAKLPARQDFLSDDYLQSGSRLGSADNASLWSPKTAAPSPPSLPGHPSPMYSCMMWLFASYDSLLRALVQPPHPCVGVSPVNWKRIASKRLLTDSASTELR
eukprot:345864-Chlamydomonas_euryale.AAC.2